MATDYFMEYGMGTPKAEIEEDLFKNPFNGLGSLTGSQLGGYAQVGGLVTGTVDDLFGTGGKTKKQQLANMKKSSVLLDQQIANNTQSMADKKLFNENMAKSSNSAMGLGKVTL